jgi:hypothetical protein
MKVLTMQESSYSAELTITGCGLFPGEECINLERCGDGYRITCKSDLDGRQTETFCNVSVLEVDRQFELLRLATVCAYPISPLVCDGEYVEVTVHGEYADLTMGWWSDPPRGADALFDFSEWMRRLIESDRDEAFEDSDDE